MGLSSSLNASVMGLQVNSQRLSGISDNIANSQTNGYKRANTDFSSLVNYGNTASSYNAGGVRATTTREVTQQGSLIATGNSTDISVNGPGLLPVTTVAEREDPAGSRDFLLTTTGSFTKDDEGFLRTTGGLQLLGWRTNEVGEIGPVSRESAADLDPVNLSGFEFAPNPTTEVDMSVNLPSAADPGDAFSMTIEYFDALGASHSMVLDFTAVNPATGGWNLTLTDSSTGGAGTLVADFDMDFATGLDPNPGALTSVTASPTAPASAVGTYDPLTGEITVPGASGDISFKIGRYGEFANLTQFANDFAPVNISKNGSTLGFLSAVEMNDEGFLEGIYDTGLRRSLYKIPIANVSNPEGLSPEDNQAFRISNTSGPVYLWDSGEGPVGTLNGYTLEESTTDITEELTQLIQTQRAYSSNAKIVQTVDEMLQETTNLKR